MPETGGASIEVAHHLNEAHAPSHLASKVHQGLEVIEAIILALVAITTAWSGYQAARWDSAQSELYGHSSRLLVEGQALDVEANQEKMYNAATVAEWLRSQVQGDLFLANFLERRLL